VSQQASALKQFSVTSPELLGACGFSISHHSEWFSVQLDENRWNPETNRMVTIAAFDQENGSIRAVIPVAVRMLTHCRAFQFQWLWRLYFKSESNFGQFV